MLAVPGAENRLFSALTSLSAVAGVPAEAGLDSLKRSTLILGVAEVFQAEYPLSDYFVKEHNRVLYGSFAVCSARFLVPLRLY